MRVRADGLLDRTLDADWRGFAIAGAIVLIGLVSLLGMVLANRRRAEERRQLEVPRFSAQEFHRFADHQQWIVQQSVLPAVPPPHPPPDPPPDQRPAPQPPEQRPAPPRDGPAPTSPDEFRWLASRQDQTGRPAPPG
jgi:hypothetical protein